MGLDATRSENQDSLAAIARAGHEIGNHSFHHDQWLHEYSRDQIHQELQQSEVALREVTGKQTVGFRGPGFSYSRDVIKVLIERGYVYDGSTFPPS